MCVCVRVCVCVCLYVDMYLHTYIPIACKQARHTTIQSITFLSHQGSMRILTFSITPKHINK